MSKCLAYICNTFGVPARRGERVQFPSSDGQTTEGVIVGARGRMLRVELADKAVVSVDPRRCQYLGLGLRFEALREAERRVLGLMAEHYTQESAAEAGGLALETVKTTLRDARLVLGCVNSMEAVLMWDRHQRGQVIDGAAA